MLGLVSRRIRKAKVSEFVNLNASFKGPVFYKRLHISATSCGVAGGV